MDLESAISELYRKAATELPFDVLAGLSECLKREKLGSLGAKTLKIILENARIARETSRPICQDTGTPIFFVKYGPDFRQKEILEAIWRATERAEREVPMRRNRVLAIGGLHAEIDSLIEKKTHFASCLPARQALCAWPSAVKSIPLQSGSIQRPEWLVRSNKKNCSAPLRSLRNARNDMVRPDAYPIEIASSLGRQGDLAPRNDSICYFDERDAKGVEIGLLLKGGGSENVSMTYSLPNKRLRAERDLDGIRRCVLDSAVAAQGRGCPPMIASVVAGSPEDLVVVTAKRQLLRKIGSVNPDPSLAAFEKDLTHDINELGIGPGGFGGKSTVMASFVTLLPRHPASFFVHVSYFCWASRRGVMEFLDGKAKFL